ncbi:hypothetical protein N9B90_00760 [bacterium]|nr:hypothetical protein [bacterium]
MMQSRQTMLTALALAVTASVAPGQHKQQLATQETETFGITDLPTNQRARLGRVSVRKLRREGFTKCAAVHKRAEGAIWIVAQDGVRNIAVARARNLLEFYLKPLPNAAASEVARKQQVITKMIANGAMLMMPTGAHEEGQEPRIEAQPLFEAETPVDGSRWYIENDWEHRDAAFEEIFHLVHDTGIGTYLPGAMPTYQAALDKEARSAIADGRWGNDERDTQNWLRKLEEEDSLAQEYIASVIDTYYGLWGSFREEPGGMWGIYCAKNRQEQARLDPRGQQLLKQFLPPFLHGYQSLLDPNFDGQFLMTFDKRHPYTHKSRYLVEVRLTGGRSSGITGNAQDNVLTGNSGDNHLQGESGKDTVCFVGDRSEYEVIARNKDVVVKDLVADRDGTDSLQNVEVLRFADGDVFVENALKQQRKR